MSTCLLSVWRSMLVIGATLVALHDASAVTITVTRLDDPVGGACPGATCSLRAAISTANATAGVDLVSITGGSTYLLQITGSGEDANATGDLDITESVNFQVTGGGTATVDATAATDRVLHVIAGSTSLPSVVLRGGALSGANGGGILIDAAAGLTLTGSTVTANVLSGGTDAGGGIAVGTGSGSASLILSTSTVSQNAAPGRGGGIWLANGSSLSGTNSTLLNNAANEGGGLFVGVSATASLTGSTVADNDVTGSGGGIYNDACASTTLTNGTVSSNAAFGSGGGIFNNISFGCGTLTTLNNVTVAYNASGVPAGMTPGNGDGGGFFNADAGSGFIGLTSIANSLFAWNFDFDTVNTGYKPDYAGRFSSTSGYNFVQDPTGTTFTGTTTGNLPAFSNPNIGVLRGNGGPTDTIALYLGSDAINAANPGPGGVLCPGTDQRGTARPIPVGGRCDIGAFEAPVCGNSIQEAPEDCDGGANCDAFCRFTSPTADHNEPKTASETSGQLVTAYTMCSAGTFHTLTPPTPSMSACSATPADALCKFSTTASTVKADYRVRPLTSSGDLNVRVAFVGLDTNCTGQQLDVYVSFRQTVQNCASSTSPTGIGSCTVTESLLQNILVGSCTVSGSGGCTVDEDFNASPSLPDLQKGRRTGLEIQSVAVKRGAITSFVPGVLIP
jgi:CSLREA domain-containing protein